MELLQRLMITRGGVDLVVRLDQPHDLSISLDFEGAQPNAFSLPRANAAPFAAGQFVASVDHGAGFNCDGLSIYPHGNGTHTECAGHICQGAHFVHEHLREALIPATLLSVELTRLGDAQDTYPHLASPEDWVITADALHAAFEALDADLLWFDALILRTFPNDREKTRANYTGQNPAYLSQEAMRWIVNRQVRHLLVDLPSVDREEDQGALPNHHTFWHIPQGQHQLSEAAHGRTITELIYVANEIPDAHYLLNLQIPPLLSDAAPSRPILYPLERRP